MSELVVSPDGTGFLSVGQESPVTPSPQQTPVAPSSPQQGELDLRQQLGLAPATPSVEETPKQMTVQELVEKGLLDPKGRHDLTVLESYKRTVSALQAEKARVEREAAELHQFRQQVEAQQRQSERERELQRRLQEAAPHERLRVQREFQEEELNEQRQQLAQQQQFLEDTQEIENWKVRWQREDGIPPMVLKAIDDLTARMGVTHPRQRFEILEAGRRKFLEDRAAGRLPGQNPAQQATPPQQPTTPGIPHVPVVAPSGTGAGQLNINQQLSAAMRSLSSGTPEEQSRQWRDVYASLGITDM